MRIFAAILSVIATVAAPAIAQAQPNLKCTPESATNSNTTSYEDYEIVSSCEAGVATPALPDGAEGGCAVWLTADIRPSDWVFEASDLRYRWSGGTQNPKFVSSAEIVVDRVTGKYSYSKSLSALEFHFIKVGGSVGSCEVVPAQKPKF